MTVLVLLLSFVSTQVSLKKGDTILNSFTGKTERVGRMVEMQADDRTELSEAQAGDILAIVGMKKRSNRSHIM